MLRRQCKADVARFPMGAFGSRDATGRNDLHGTVLASLPGDGISAGARGIDDVDESPCEEFWASTVQHQCREVMKDAASDVRISGWLCFWLLVDHCLIPGARDGVAEPRQLAQVLD